MLYLLLFFVFCIAAEKIEIIDRRTVVGVVLYSYLFCWRLFGGPKSYFSSLCCSPVPRQRHETFVVCVCGELGNARAKPQGQICLLFQGRKLYPWPEATAPSMFILSHPIRLFFLLAPASCNPCQLTVFSFLLYVPLETAERYVTADVSCFFFLLCSWS